MKVLKFVINIVNCSLFYTKIVFFCYGFNNDCVMLEIYLKAFKTHTKRFYITIVAKLNKPHFIRFNNDFSIKSQKYNQSGNLANSTY